MPNVAIVDIGSNSIKVLVAHRNSDGQVIAEFQKTSEVRISAGISAEQPTLLASSMSAGLGAIKELISFTGNYSPVRTILVATSAVRDATNGQEFCDMVKNSTGHAIRILSGDEEAGAIGRGLLCDPNLSDLQDFTLVDLGGGSLECLSFRDRRIVKRASLPLGCVRLTEKFVPDLLAPISEQIRDAIASYTKRKLHDSGITPPPAGSLTIATGGSLASIRSINASKLGTGIDETQSKVSLEELFELFGLFIGRSLSETKPISGLSKARTDVFPAALASLIGVTDHFANKEFHHSFYNLRYGIAASALDSL